MSGHNPELQARKRLYGSSRWQKFRAQYIKRNPICSAPGCGKPAKIVDHVLGHDGDWRSRFWTGPFAALCKPHHSQKTITTEQVNPWVKRGTGGGVRDQLGAPPRGSPSDTFGRPPKAAFSRHSPAASAAERFKSSRLTRSTSDGNPD